MMRRIFLAVVLTLTARAHDTWLQPAKFSVPAGTTVMLEMTSADGFKGAETAIKPERISFAIGRLAGGPLVLGEPVTAAKTMQLPVTLPHAGVAVIGVALKPRLLDLAADKIELYLTEIHADAALRAQWTAVPEPRKWRELYVKNTKTFVRAGEPAADSTNSLQAADRAWAEPLGQALEVLPERDPTLLHVGEDLPVRVLRGGKPFAGFTISFVAEGETKEHVEKTDTDGRAHAVLDAPGAWLVHGTDLRRVMRADREWESDFTTMVVEARPASAR